MWWTAVDESFARNRRWSAASGGSKHRAHLASADAITPASALADSRTSRVTSGYAALSVLALVQEASASVVASGYAALSVLALMQEASASALLAWLPSRRSSAQAFRDSVCLHDGFVHANVCRECTNRNSVGSIRLPIAANRCMVGTDRHPAQTDRLPVFFYSTPLADRASSPQTSLGDLIFGLRGGGGHCGMVHGEVNQVNVVNWRVLRTLRRVYSGCFYGINLLSICGVTSVWDCASCGGRTGVARGLS
jgi:hypothetical protein